MNIWPLVKTNVAVCRGTIKNFVSHSCQEHAGISMTLMRVFRDEMLNGIVARDSISVARLSSF